MQLNHDRLLDSLRQLAQFGKSGTGVNRLSFTPEDRAARAWLLEQMRAAGLDARIDGIGNVYGQATDVDRAVLIGSHTDSVPKGGWLDGAMGVLYGLEVARTRHESQASNGPARSDEYAALARLGVDVISFADEEGTYRALAGSLSFCGELSDTDIESATTTGGTSLTEALTQAGYAGQPRARLDPGRHLAYFEGHIEQGPRLEVENQKIGIVTTIVGIRRSRLTCLGQADHAGTTPMHLRKDAGAALIKLCARLLERFEQARGELSVWNIGHIVFAPGAGNVVPNSAQALVEFRDPQLSVLDRLQSEIDAAAAELQGCGGVTVEVEHLLSIAPADMDASLVDTVETATRNRAVPAIRMPSGAGHDAMVLSRYLPSAMLFIPSIGGRSHDVAENTNEEDICLGADILADGLELLARQKGLA